MLLASRSITSLVALFALLLQLGLGVMHSATVHVDAHSFDDVALAHLVSGHDHSDGDYRALPNDLHVDGFEFLCVLCGPTGKNSKFIGRTFISASQDEQFVHRAQAPPVRYTSAFYLGAVPSRAPPFSA